jgi:pimeloyl-ACP methyl ester carboxylesterase
VQCGTLEVPFDYDDPAKGSFQLHLERRPADKPKKRIGSLLVNPGGPGFGGAMLASDAEFYFSEALTDAFDIIGWDPRGTGQSTPSVDCIDDYDPYFAFDPSPDTPEEQREMEEAGQAFVDACLERSAEILPYISTTASARDMDRIRAALGEDTISYFGFSYGSELGATWVSMFPTTVRAAVLDGATDPTADYVSEGLQQAQGFERQLSAFLADCSARKTCDFHNSGNSEDAFDQLLRDLDISPLVVKTSRPAVNQGVALIATAYSMYSQSSWPNLAAALSDAQGGDGAKLLALFDSYYQRQSDGTFGNELEAFYAIMCLDDPGPKSIEEVDSYRPQFVRVAPRLGDSFAAGYVCALWPSYDVLSVPITGKGAGPIIVIGTTGDAATPIESTQKMATTLEDGILITVTAERHTGYGVNNCVVKAVDTYLTQNKVPPRDLMC